MGGDRRVLRRSRRGEEGPGMQWEGDRRVLRRSGRG